MVLLQTVSTSSMKYYLYVQVYSYHGREQDIYLFIDRDQDQENFWKTKNMTVSFFAARPRHFFKTETRPRRMKFNRPKYQDQDILFETKSMIDL